MATLGIDFRATLGYVTDPAGDSANLVVSANYPTTYGNGLVGGWEDADGDGARDRNNAIDARLAGMNFNGDAGANPKRFRVDLANGTYLLNAAHGDASNAQTQYVIYEDGTTALATYAAVSTAAGSFMDANGNVYTAANWPASNTQLSITITTGIFRCVLGTGNHFSNVAHLAFTPSGGASSWGAQLSDQLNRIVQGN